MPLIADPSGGNARASRGERAFPTTGFYAADATLAFSHVGGYATQAKLVDDIKRYAIDG